MLRSSQMFGLILVATLVAQLQAVQFQLLNRAGGPIWVGIQGNPGHEHLSNGGVILQQNERTVLNSASNWAGRFWARTWCNSGTRHCETGDCGNKIQCAGAGGVPPVSLAEITLKGSGGLDYYDISLVDGYNLQISIEPIGGQGDGGTYSCKKSACSANLLQNCPQELQLKGNSGPIIACKSACEAFQTDQYCCRGAHDKPETCKSSSWPKDYPAWFKQQCPDAYSYAYDDHKSTFTCKAEVYLIIFG